MNTAMMAMILASMLATLLLIVGFWLPSSQPNHEKISPYECGFDPIGSARLPFSLRFFLVALVFVLFDLEIALLLPLPWSYQLDTPDTSFLWASAVLIILTLGLAYEWCQGALEWAE